MIKSIIRFFKGYLSVTFLNDALRRLKFNVSPLWTDSCLGKILLPCLSISEKIYPVLKCPPCGRRIRGMKKKTVLSSLSPVWPLILCGFAAGCLGLPSAQTWFQPGIYEGTGRGYRGVVRVRVQVSASGIEDIEIMDHREDGFAAAAMEELRDTVLEYGTTDIDAVAGATVSSRGFLRALESALETAKTMAPGTGGP
jgi:uncharacterized protein with FMN-binding domain